MTSNLTEAADRAAAQITRERDGASAAIAGPVLREADAALDQSAAKALASAKAFLTDLATHRVLEHNRAHFARVTGQPQRQTLAGESTDAATFVSRVDAELNRPRLARPVALAPLAEPNFGDLVAS